MKTYRITTWQASTLAELSPVVMAFLQQLPQPQSLPCCVSGMFADWKLARDVHAIVPAGRFSTTFSLESADNRTICDLVAGPIGDVTVAQCDRKLTLVREMTWGDHGHTGDREINSSLWICSQLPSGSFELSQHDQERELAIAGKVCEAINKARIGTHVTQSYAHHEKNAVWSNTGIRLPCEEGGAALRAAVLAASVDKARFSWELLGSFSEVNLGMSRVPPETSPGGGLPFIESLLPGSFERGSWTFALERSSWMRPTANTNVSQLPSVFAQLDKIERRLAFPAIQVAPVVWTPDGVSAGGAFGNRLSVLRSHGRWNVWLETQRIADTDPAERHVKAAIESIIASVRPSSLTPSSIVGD